jgi:hypothetical protein
VSFGSCGVPCNEEHSRKTLIIIRYVLVRERQYATGIAVAGSRTWNTRWPDRRTVAGRPDPDDLELRMSNAVEDPADVQSVDRAMSIPGLRASPVPSPAPDRQDHSGRAGAAQ